MTSFHWLKHFLRDERKFFAVFHQTTEVNCLTILHLIPFSVFFCFGIFCFGLRFSMPQPPSAGLRNARRERFFVCNLILTGKLFFSTFFFFFCLTETFRSFREHFFFTSRKLRENNLTRHKKLIPYLWVGYNNVIFFFARTQSIIGSKAPKFGCHHGIRSFCELQKS